MPAGQRVRYVMDLSPGTLSVWFLVLAQCVCAVRIGVRMARPSQLAPLTAEAAPEQPCGISVIVPVLDEVKRLAPALRSLSACGGDVDEIFVVDGGSHDATVALAEAFAARDARIRVVRAGTVPAGWNGKAHNLAVGLGLSSSRYFLGIDADVRIAPELPAALSAVCEQHQLGLVSVATKQKTGGIASAALHAALLATLVYRSGRPGGISRTPGRIQANGQVFFAPADVLRRTTAFAASRTSRCDDLTIAHALAAAGNDVAFVEAPDLASVAMYTDVWETALNWPRSLTLRDRTTRFLAPLRLLETALVLALPLLISGAFIFMTAPHTAALAALRIVNAGLLLARFGVLAGIARAYVKPRIGYLLSPLLDGPAVMLLAASMLTREVTWRGRTLVPASTAS